MSVLVGCLSYACVCLVCVGCVWHVCRMLVGWLSDAWCRMLYVGHPLVVGVAQGTTLGFLLRASFPCALFTLFAVRVS